MDLTPLCQTLMLRRPVFGLTAELATTNYMYPRPSQNFEDRVRPATAAFGP